MAIQDDRFPSGRSNPRGKAPQTPRPRKARPAASADGRARAGAPSDSRAAAPRSKGPSPARKRRPVLRIVLVAIALGLVALGVTGCVVFNNVAGSLPDPTKPLKGTDLTTRVLDRNGKPITDLFAEQNRQYVALKDIPSSLREAVIATEDQRYYEHPGVDLIGLLRAVVVDIKAGAQVQGGSTITQQYVKQAFVGDESSIRRKISEAILAYRIEQKYSKDQILEMYLNTIYFGHGSYGVQTAAQAYFGKPVDKLSVAEAAMLAGVIKSPARYSPYLDPAASRSRRDTVLGQMRDQGYVDAPTYQEAVASPIVTAGLKKGSKVAPYFVEYLKTQLVALYGEDMVYRGGLQVITTLDTKMQTAAENAVSKLLDRKTDPSAALVSIDPKTGQILAMVGGRDFATQQYNVAVQGHRQSGSSFKPFVLVAALASGISPEQTYKADSTKLTIPGGQTWSVAGEPGYKGLMRLRVATWHSINPVFAQLVLKIGADNVVNTAHDMGVVTKITPVPAVALGGMAEGVTPLEMASAYATLADGGMHAAPVGILKVTDKDGKVLFEAKTATKRAVDAAVAYLTTDILRGVILHGTGTAAGIGRPAAGKTGTTQNNADAWFCGYTPDLATAVWVGYADSQRPMTSVHGIRVTGGSFPARIWSAYMRAALAGRPTVQFVRPSGLVDARICLDSGGAATPLCPKTGSAIFLEGKVPDPCPLHTTPIGMKMPNLVGLSKLDAIAALDKLSLRYSVLQADVPGVAAGIVASQDPANGSTITSVTVVTVTVATGGAAANKPPNASFEWSPPTPSTGSPVRFDASASTDDGTIAKWTWEFGDGTKDSSSGKVATHRFAAAGSYAVVLWVTDDRGSTVSLTKRVTVR
ncbi:MAG TPA: PBP1A family penicillin-binding protein [Coriobacteriia bacterium]